MASGATEFVDATTATVYIPALWSKYVIRAREQALCFSRLFTHKYEADAPYGATINVPNSQKGGLKFTPASAAAAFAVAKKSAEPPVASANSLILPTDSPGLDVKNSRSITANDARIAYHITYWNRT